jgi:hypothetical protein
MKEFLKVSFDLDQCRRDLADFRALLDGKQELEEAADVKPFFEARPQLAALIGSWGLRMSRCDLVAYQYQLFGDFGCDLVVGDSARKLFGFIEWEDATAGCLFRQQGKKATPEWSTRFEHGLSQVIDWFWKLDEMAHTEEFEERFGARRASYFGLLVVGRDSLLAHARERRRWQWRSHKVLVNSLPIHLATYDQLYHDLASELDKYRPPAGPSSPAPG